MPQVQREDVRDCDAHVDPRTMRIEPPCQIVIVIAVADVLLVIPVDRAKRGDADRMVATENFGLVALKQPEAMQTDPPRRELSSIPRLALPQRGHLLRRGDAGDVDTRAGRETRRLRLIEIDAIGNHKFRVGASERFVPSDGIRREQRVRVEHHDQVAIINRRTRIQRAKAVVANLIQSRFARVRAADMPERHAVAPADRRPDAGDEFTDGGSVGITRQHDRGRGYGLTADGPECCLQMPCRMGTQNQVNSWVHGVGVSVATGHLEPTGIRGEPRTLAGEPPGEHWRASRQWHRASDRTGYAGVESAWTGGIWGQRRMGWRRRDDEETRRGGMAARCLRTWLFD